ncbi:MAG: hypothetical protein D6729_05845 [Deltaproteobacteria bacterium]|nr:MAG: hypothetical protein D6729_05845 [Deltaproteobacteria bacterium]
MFLLLALAGNGCLLAPSDGAPDGGSGGDSGAPAVGSACTSGADCAGDLSCHLGLPGGYCTRVCEGGGACPVGSVCGVLDGQPLCLRLCADGTACRAGYACVSEVCIPEAADGGSRPDGGGTGDGGARDGGPEGDGGLAPDGGADGGPAGPCDGWPPSDFAEPTCGPAPLSVRFLGDPIASSYPADQGCTFYEMQWDFGDGTTSSEIDPVHVYEAGDYEAVVKSFGQCCMDGSCYDLNLDLAPIRIRAHP